MPCRLTTPTGLEGDIAYPHFAAILRNEEGINLARKTGEFQPIDETTVVHLQLAITAVRETHDTAYAQYLAKVVADMHNPEARWWCAHYLDHDRPKPSSALSPWPGLDHLAAD